MTTYDERRQTEINSEVAERMIWVRFEKEGIHKYPAALENLSQSLYCPLLKELL